jgi:predicted RNA-binding protein associated with RNAse of E/G family
VLRLVAPQAAHALDLRWDERWRFLGWYVNLQTPLRPIPRGFDYTDWALDLEVTPAGAWRWKDEQDLAEAQALGIVSPETAAAARQEGERVLSERPWPTGLESWRPDPAWPLPADEA